MKKVYMLFIVLFLVLSIIPLVGTLILPKSENRANQILSPAPELLDNSQRLGLNINYLSDFNDYFADNFAFRQELITANSAILSGIFASSNTYSVILGNDGWLFYASTADDFQNVPTMTERDALNAAISLSLMEEYAAVNGSKLVFTIAPNKNSICPQYMPYNYISSDQTGNIELMTAALNNVGVCYADLFPALETGGETLYHQLDSHWNNLGASIAQLCIMESLGLEGTDYSTEQYETRQDFSGDLYEMLYPTGTRLDYNQYFSSFTYTSSDDVSDICVSAKNAGAQYCLVMYRDSFGNALVPFMAQEFEKSIFSRAVPYNLDMISDEHADFVVIEIAQRNIDTLSTRAAIMQAPFREIPLPDNMCDVNLSATASSVGQYTMITGTFTSKINDPGSRIYAVLSFNNITKIFEAAPVGTGGDGSFTLYISENIGKPDNLSLILQSDGKQFITNEIALSS